MSKCARASSWKRRIAAASGESSRSLPEEERVVADEQAARTRVLGRPAPVAVVVGLVRVDEDRVERAEGDEPRQHVESPALVNGDRLLRGPPPRSSRARCARASGRTRSCGRARPRGRARAARIAEYPASVPISTTWRAPASFRKELESLPFGGSELDGRHLVFFRRVERARERRVVRRVRGRDPVEDLRSRVPLAGAGVGIGHGVTGPRAREASACRRLRRARP